MIIIIIVSYSIFVLQNILIAPASALRAGGDNPPPQLQSNCDSGFATVQPFSFKHPPLLKSGSSPAILGDHHWDNSCFKKSHSSFTIVATCSEFLLTPFFVTMATSLHSDIRVTCWKFHAGVRLRHTA